MSDSDSNVTLRDVLEMLKAIQKDVQTGTDEAKVYKEELERTKERVTALEYGQNIIVEELRSLRQVIDELETPARRNNILLFNFPESRNESIDKLMDNFISLSKDKLEIELQKTEIDYIRRIGKPNNRSPRPVLIKLVTSWRKHEFLSSNPKLKGEGMNFAEDLPPKVRRLRKDLIPYMLEARQLGHRATLRRGKLMVDGELYTLEQLKKRRDEVRARQPNDDVTSSPMKRKYEQSSLKQLSERSAAALERFSFRQRRSSLPSTSNDMDLSRSPPSKVPAT